MSAPRKKMPAFFIPEGSCHIHLETGYPLYDVDPDEDIAPEQISEALGKSEIPEGFPKGRLLGIFDDGLLCPGFFLSDNQQIEIWFYRGQFEIPSIASIEGTTLHVEHKGGRNVFSLERLDRLFSRAPKYFVNRLGCNLSGWRWLGMIGDIVKHDATYHPPENLSPLLHWNCTCINRRAHLSPHVLGEEESRRPLHSALL